ETMYTPLANSLRASLHRHTVVILANENITRLNIGSVPLFPHMSTFSMMPQQDFWGTNDWITTLTVSEARHLVQIAKMRHGFGKVASIFLGEAGLVAAVGLSLRRALVAAPFLWVAVELARTRITAFPWELLEYSQTANFALTRIATLVGVYG